MEIKRQNLWTWLQLTWDILFSYVIAYIWNRKQQSIPPLERRTNIVSKKIADIVKGIKSKDIKSSDLVSATLERITIVNPIINAVTAKRFPLALKDADEIDGTILNASPEHDVLKKPLLGVPFTVQESLGVKDMLCTMGLISRKHFKSSVEPDCVKLLKEAGAVLIATSNIPEIDLWYESRNKLFGQTNNPHHTGRTVGGSGGGEAALVSSLCSSFGLCHDVYGSALMAASYCGVFAHVPTPGMVSSKGPISNKDLNPAVVTRTAEDLMAVTGVLSNQKLTFTKLAKVEMSTIKVYYPEISVADSEIAKKYMNKVLACLKTNTASSVNTIQLENFNDIPFMRRCRQTSEAEENSQKLANRKGKLVGGAELVKKLLGVSRHTLGSILALINYPPVSTNDIAAAETLLARMKTKLMDTLGSDGVMLLPMGLRGAPYHYAPYLKQHEHGFWSLASLTQCPATQVPIGTDDEGMPVSMQVIAAPNNDELCLQVASYLEKSFGGYIPPCHTETTAPF